MVEVHPISIVVARLYVSRQAACMGIRLPTVSASMQEGFSFSHVRESPSACFTVECFRTLSRLFRANTAHAPYGNEHVAERCTRTRASVVEHVASVRSQI